MQAYHLFISRGLLKTRFVGCCGLEESESEAGVDDECERGDDPRDRRRGREELMSEPMTTTPGEQVRDESLAAMTEAERAEYDAAAVEAEARLHLAELVYDARVAAGVSQTELARLAGTRQSVISAIENGAQAPAVSCWRGLPERWAELSRSTPSPDLSPSR